MKKTILASRRVGRPKIKTEVLKANNLKRIRTLKAKKEKIVPASTVKISKSAPNPKFYFVEGTKPMKKRRTKTSITRRPKRRFRKVGNLQNMTGNQIQSLVKDVLIGAGLGVGYKYVANTHLYPILNINSENARMGIDAGAGVGMLLASRKFKKFRKYLISGGTAILTLTAFELYQKLLKNTNFGGVSGLTPNSFRDVSGMTENVFREVNTKKKNNFNF